MLESNIKQRLVGSALTRKQINFPAWGLWLLVVLCVVTLAGLVFGGIQWYRVYRWSKLLEQSKVVITEQQKTIQRLESEKVQEYSRGLIDASKRALTDIDKKEAILKQQQQEIEKKKKEIKKTVTTLSVNNLLKEFEKEGFTGTIRKEDVSEKNSTSLPVQKNCCPCK